MRRGDMKILGLAALIPFLLLASCRNPFLAHPPAGDEAVVLLSIGDSLARPRTVLPSAPAFTKYILSFAPLDGQGPIADQEATSTTVSMTLEEGRWTISVTGYAMFNAAEVAVADGSVEVTAIGGLTVNATISIGPLATAGDGTFDYNISVPMGLPATSYDVYLGTYGSFSSSVDSGSVDTSSSPFSHSGSQTVPAGYYVATIYLYTPGSTAVRMEIVHVATNMVSTANFSFGLDDFVPSVSISGNLAITVDGSPYEPSGWQLRAYTDPNDIYGSTIKEFYVWTGGMWNITVQTLESPATVYFLASGNYGASYITQAVPETTVLFNTDVSAISLSLALNTVTLSGSLSLTIDGAPYDSSGWSVSAQSSSGTNLGSATVSGGYWSIAVLANAAPVQLSFLVSGDAGGVWHSKMAPGTWSVSNVNVSGIDLVVSSSMITISGTFSATIGGVSQTVSSWNVIMSELVPGTYLSPQYLTVDAMGNWSTSLVPKGNPSTFSFSVSGTDHLGNSVYSDLPGTWQSADVDLTGITLSYTAEIPITLSGNLSASLNGSPQGVDGWYVYAYADGQPWGNYGYVGTDGSWSISGQPVATEVPLSFRVSGNIGDSYVSQDIAGTWLIGNLNLTGLNLVADFQRISLSGSLALSVTMNGLPSQVDTVRIRVWGPAGVLGEANLSTDGSWSLMLPPQTQPTPVSFTVIGMIDGFYQFWEEVPGFWTIHASDMEGISLNLSSAISTLQLSGTLAVTLNGAALPISDWNVSAYTDPERHEYLKSTNTGYASNDWSMVIDAFEASTPVYFWVSGNGPNGYISKLVPGSWTVHDAGQSGISLSLELNTIQLSGSLDLTVDGAGREPYNWRVYAYTDPLSPFSSAIGWDELETGGAWNMAVERFLAPTTVYFRISGEVDDQNINAFLLSPTLVEAANISGISLSYDFTMINLSGSLSLGIDGVSQDPSNWEIYAAVEGSPMTLNTKPDASGAWSISLPAFVAETTIHLTLMEPSETIPHMYAIDEVIQVYNADQSGISLVIEIETVPVGGVVLGPSTYSFIYAFQDPSTSNSALSTMIGTGIIFNGVWSMEANAALLGSDVYFMIGGNVGSNLMSASPISIPATGFGGIALDPSVFVPVPWWSD